MTSCRVTDDGPRVFTGAPAFINLFLLFLALLLAADPALSQEDESESSPNGTLSAGDGKAEIESDERRLFAGDGCALIEGGGRTLAAGDCEEGDSEQDRNPGGSDSDSPDPGEPEDTNPEEDGPESTSPEDEEEPESPAGEQYEPTDEETSTEEETSLEEETLPESTEPEETMLEETMLEETMLEETMLEESTSTTDPDALCPIGPPTDALEATVTRAVDGDTVEIEEPVEGVDAVRLIGVDTPEMEGEGGDSEPYAEEAARFTADALEGEEVLLEIGREPQDDYGRLLAYVWLVEPPEDTQDEEETTSAEGAAATGSAVEGGSAPSDASLFSNIAGFFADVVGSDSEGAAAQAEDLSGMFNLALLEGGYAEVFAVEPNTAYEECFEEAEERASAQERYESTDEKEETSQEEETSQQEETSLPENTVSEETTSEDTDPEEAETPESPAQEQYEDTDIAEAPDDTGDRQEEPGALEAARPDGQSCADAELLEELSGQEGDEVRSVQTARGPLLLSYDVRPDDEASAEGMLLVSVVDSGGRAAAEPVSFEELGQQQALLEVEPGAYEIQIAAVNRDYAFAAYECAGAQPTTPQQTDGAEEQPSDSGGQEPPSVVADGNDAPRSAPQSAPTDDPAGEAPPTDEAAVPDDPFPGASPAAYDEPMPEEAARETLPTEDTPEGIVAVLPDTGGAGILQLAVGCAMISAGSFMFVALRMIERGSSARYSGKRQRL